MFAFSGPFEDLELSKKEAEKGLEKLANENCHF
jgi:hypothetical protein